MATTYTYQQLLMNAINQVISDLLGGSQPGSDPGKTAWTWFGATDTAEPSQVNSYMEGQINSTSVSTKSFSPSNNWASWSSAMNTAFGTATGTVADWLAQRYTPVVDDLPTVPDDVITWTTQNLPTGTDVVVVGGRVASRAGGR